MAQSMIRFYLATADSLSSIQVESSLTVEELCGKICRRLEILPISQHLFALRIHGSYIFLAPNSTVDSSNAYDFRIRFKVSSPSRLKDLDLGAFNYYYHQVRKEVLNSKIPEIEYQKHKNQLVGLGVTDIIIFEMYDAKITEKDPWVFNPLSMSQPNLVAKQLSVEYESTKSGCAFFSLL